MPTLTAKEQRVLAAVLSERTLDEAAAKASLSVRTLYRWLAERPAFRDAYRAELRGVMAAVTGRVQGSAIRALEALEGVLADDKARPAERASAAAKILDLAFRAHELGDIEQRIDALERDRKPANLGGDDRDRSEGERP